VFTPALALTALLAPGSGPEAVPTEVACLAGRWELVRRVVGGESSRAEPGELVVAFGPGFVRYHPDHPDGGTFALRNLSPDTFDMDIFGGTMLYRYGVEGDTLFLCRPVRFGPTEVRPPALVSTEKPPTKLEVYRRRR
jgi:hypothetical protein